MKQPLPPPPTQGWSKRDYPPVLYITYAYDDTDEAPVLDVSHTLGETRRNMERCSGVVYRTERLPEAGWKDPNKPEYGNETFVESIA